MCLQSIYCATATATADTIRKKKKKKRMHYLITIPTITTLILTIFCASNSSNNFNLASAARIRRGGDNDRFDIKAVNKIEAPGIDKSLLETYGEPFPFLLDTMVRLPFDMEGRRRSSSFFLSNDDLKHFYAIRSEFSSFFFFFISLFVFCLFDLKGFGCKCLFYFSF